MKNTVIDQIIEEKYHNKEFLDKIKSENQYKHLNLSFNPFPKSGTTNINSSDSIITQMPPFENNVKQNVDNFIIDTLIPKTLEIKDRFMSAVITGDYGIGKTHLMLYMKSLIELSSQASLINKKPYVIYIDNPGVKLEELIGNLIFKIGEENFKKFLWKRIINEIKKNSRFSTELNNYKNTSQTFFPVELNPFADENTINYKRFLDVWLKDIVSPYKRKDFERDLKKVLLSILNLLYKDSVITQYFYDIVCGDFGINSIWESLISGNSKHMENKTVELLKAIVDLLENEDFTDFYIFVDEFEDLTGGRLTKQRLDNYLHNLRILLDKDRNWCVVFAMTSNAYEKLKQTSPPLAERIGVREIILTRLSDVDALKLVLNYLNLARDTESSDLLPFEEAAINYINKLSDGIPRRFLQKCFEIIERAKELLENSKIIDEQFVKNYFQPEV